MADARSIHEFTTGQVEATTLLLGDFVDLDAQSGYMTLKMSVSDLGEVLLEDIEYTQDLQTVDKTIVGAINENKSVIGYSYDVYDATTAYAKDDLCIYNNTLYKAKQATTGNLPTNTTYWEQTSIADEIAAKADKGVSNSVSGTLDVAMNQNAFITYRTVQNLLIVSAVFNANSAVSSNTQIAHISGVSQIGQTFVSSNGDKGTAGRFKMQNGKIINEFAMPSSEYFSLTFVSFI